MRIVVVGAGGQGTYLTGVLSLSGEEAVLVARGERVAMLRAAGITVADGEAIPRSVRVPVVDGAIAAGGIADLIVLAVKTYDLVEAARGVAPIVGPSTYLMTVQNGVTAADIVAGLYRPERVVACVSYTRAHLESPGVVASGGVSGGLEVGGFSGADSAAVDAIVKVFEKAGLDARRRDDIRTALWEKLLIVCVTGGVMAQERSPLGPVLATDAGRDRVRRVIEEAAAVGVASGIPLPAGASGRAYEFVSTSVRADATSSMLEDLLAGRRLELEWVNGEIVRRGRELGIPTPENLAICEALEPYVEGGRRN